MKKILCPLLATYVALYPAAPALRATAVIASTEPTQIMNNIELGGISLTEIDQLATQINQLTTQIQQYQTMIHNLVNLPNQIIGNIVGSFRSVINLVDSVQSFAYTLGNLDEAFRIDHPDFESYLNGTSSVRPTDFAAQYQKWNASVNRTGKEALKTAGITLTNARTEAEALDQISSAMSSSSGQMQALHGLGQYLGMLNTQIAQLRQLAATQNAAVTTYNNVTQAKEAAANAADAKAFKIHTDAFNGTRRY